MKVKIRKTTEKYKKHIFYTTKEKKIDALTMMKAFKCSQQFDQNLEKEKKSMKTSVFEGMKGNEVRNVHLNLFYVPEGKKMFM